ncbi:DJ-1/PfpI family protein [Reichenbachiella faecimaris]|uniref:DJ-1/PfpI family protein n=1 Tax=Reichenbachiella faecimaris TaxID=692418 RepID=A0A1W2GJI6_REIFA|nr:DJ-1/PfpI family protein [Reichenbachiella faecimaris]SMD36714.1 DJ-1/PfpI family protein [Reichenbachiella faecimaris]
MKSLKYMLLLLIWHHSTLAQKAIEGDLPQDQIIYFCSPCGCSEDGKYFANSSICSACQMEFRPTMPSLERANQPTPRPSVGIFLFHGADVMDVSGPLSVFEHAGFNIITFGKQKEMTRIGMNVELMPDHSIKTLPAVDILVLPGGGLAESNPADQEVVNFLKERKDSTKVILSVCSGSFFLGEAGLLNDKKSTTFAGLIPRLASQYPKSEVLNNVKYTDNGQIVTSAGLSSGIDASFQVVSKFYGVGRAQEIANHMEYPWKREHDYARSQLAINYMSHIQTLTQLFAIDFFYSQGNQDEWECRYHLTEQMSAEKIKLLVQKELEKSGNWVIKKSNKSFLKGTVNHPMIGQGEVSFAIENKPNPIAVIKARRLQKESF